MSIGCALVTMVTLLCRVCNDWFELVEQADLSNEQAEQLTVKAQTQFQVSLLFRMIEIF